MFEKSLVTSQSSLLPSPRLSWTTIVSLAIQCAVVAVLAVIPLAFIPRRCTYAPRLRACCQRCGACRLVWSKMQADAPAGT